MQPIVPRPPKIHNLNAIPIHNHHLKHIRIDGTLFYEIACKLGALKFAVGKSGRNVNLSREWYNLNPSYYWNFVFDFKTFDCNIITNSDSISLIFWKPIQATWPKSEECKKILNSCTSLVWIRVFELGTQQFAVVLTLALRYPNLKWIHSIVSAPRGKSRDAHSRVQDGAAAPPKIGCPRFSEAKHLFFSQQTEKCRNVKNLNPVCVLGQISLQFNSSFIHPISSYWSYYCI